MNRQRRTNKWTQNRQKSRRVGAIALAAAMLVETLGTNVSVALAREIKPWKEEVTGAVSDVSEAMNAANKYISAGEALVTAYEGLELAPVVSGLKVKSVTADSVTLEWDKLVSSDTRFQVTGYNVYWADKNLDTTEFLLVGPDGKTVKPDEKEVKPTVDSADTLTFTVKKSTFNNLYFKVAPVTTSGVGALSDAVRSPKAVEYDAYLEKLDRGMTATVTAEGVYLNWRLFADEVAGFSETGLMGVDFNVYRDNAKIATVTDSTNYLDKDTKSLDGVSYKLVPVKNGAEAAAEACTDYTVFQAGTDAAFKDIKLKKPLDTTIEEVYGVKTEDIKLLNSATDGYTTTKITYIASDMSVGDVDGDGEYEYFVKWDPSLSKDVSQQGYTGKTYIDCYKLDGTLLWRLDLGLNIRSGAHYTEFGVYDYDKDGKAEMMVKTAPGSKMITYNEDGSVKSEKYVTNTESAIAKGVKDTDNYVMSAADYREYLKKVFMDWGKWEMYENKQTVKDAIDGHWGTNLVELWNATDVPELQSVNKDAKGVGYTEAEAKILVDYFMDHYQTRMSKHDLRVYEGYILTGPEYISLFDCSTGSELDTQDWYYPREDDGMLWGDYAMKNIEPGNRCDRFNVTVAYLDGETPSCIMGRGYYTRTTMVAYNVVNKKLDVAGKIDSGWTVMTNPFDDGPHGFDGCDPESGKLSGQGDHYIAVADADGDGRQDIINGGAIVSYDMDKKDLFLYSSGTGLNTVKNEVYKYGHGDAIHITDIDPDRPGLEIVSCFEGGEWAAYDWALRDTETNTAIFGNPGQTDFGRIIIGDVLKDVRGLELSTGKDCKGNLAVLAGVSTNMNIKWAADMSTQFITSAGKNADGDVSIIGYEDGKSKTFLTAQGYRTNNSTKGNPCLVADLFGDSREEIILHNETNDSLRIYMNTEVSAHKNYTLMHNTQYRVGIASQNSSYNQPAYTDYYYAYDTDWEYVTVPNQAKEQAPGAVADGGVIASEKISALFDVDEMLGVKADGEPDAVSGGMSTYKETVVDGMTTSPLDDYQFDFGTKNGSAPAPFKSPALGTDDAKYNKALGYGFLTGIPITENKHIANSSNNNVTPNGNSEYETALFTAVRDAARAGEWSFALDLPAGEYRVNIYAGTDDVGNSSFPGAVYKINGVQVNNGDQYKTAETVDDCRMSARVVLKRAGQVVLSGQNSKLALFNAITVDEYKHVTQDHNAQAWNTFITAMEGVSTEAAKVADGGTPAKDFTGNGNLVKALKEAEAAAKAVEYMQLTDTSEYDAVYAQAETAVKNSSKYIKDTITKLEKAMEDYVAAKENLNIQPQVTAFVETLAFWLDGVEYDPVTNIVTVGEGNTSELSALVAEVEAAKLKETDYTISSWKAYSDALTAAKEVISSSDKSIQKITVAYDDLSAAYDGLKKTELLTQLVLDFGPETEIDGTTAGQVTAAGLMNGLLNIDLPVAPILGKATDVYAENQDDNRNHYGFDRAVAATNTAAGGAYFRDFVYSTGGAPYTFKADVKAGVYYVYVYTGCKEANNTTKFYFGNGEETRRRDDAAKSPTPVAVGTGDLDGKYIYTQTSAAGGQYGAGAGNTDSIYKVYVAPNAAGSEQGTLSLTCFDDTEGLAADAVSARLVGLEFSYAGLVDREVLKALKAQAESLNADDYTEESYQALMDAVAKADPVLAEKDETKLAQSEIDKIENAILDAQQDLVNVHAVALKAKLDEAKAVSEAGVTADSWAVLQEAIEDAQAVYDKYVAGDAEADLKGALAKLTEVMNSLALVNKAALAAKIAEADALTAANYTADSWAAFQKVLGDAKTVNANPNATQSQVDEALNNLAAAFGTLVPAGGTAGDIATEQDKAALKEAIDKAAALTAADYTADSWAAVSAALAEANAVYGNAGATKTQVSDALAKLTNAVNALKKAAKPIGEAKGKTFTDSKKNKFKVTVQGMDDGTKPEVAFTGTGANGKSVTIPATVTIGGVTYQVTSVSKNALTKAQKKSVTKVTFGANIKTIEADAFSGATKLSTVKFNSKLETIGNKAFSKCTALKSVTFPNSVKTIGTAAFSGCKKLATVKFGKNLTKIGKQAFEGAAIKTLTIPDKVTEIGDKAFYKNTKMTKVTIGKGLTKIGKEAFRNCKKLNQVNIKSTKLKTVGKNAFKSVKKGAKATVPKSKKKAYTSKLKPLKVK